MGGGGAEKSSSPVLKQLVGTKTDNLAKICIFLLIFYSQQTCPQKYTVQYSILTRDLEPGSLSL
jgi:hypothetical protein